MRTFLFWFGLAAAPLAWALQLVGGYGIEDAICSPGTAKNDLWGAGPGALVVVLTLVCATTAVGGGAAATATLRGVRSGAIADPRGRISFAAFAAVVASTLFLVIIVLGGMQLLALDSCDA